MYLLVYPLECFFFSFVRLFILSDSISSFGTRQCVSADLALNPSSPYASRCHLVSSVSLCPLATI